MTNHREHIIKEVEFFFKDKNFKTVLELGAGNDTTFKDKFSDLNWKTTDATYGIFMEDLPFEDKTFDIVFSCHAFEHCINPIKALTEMKRVSKQYIYIITPYHCWHQVLGADNDHIFCLTDMQIERLYRYVGIKEGNIYVYKVPNKTEQFWQLVSIGKIENE